MGAAEMNRSGSCASRGSGGRFCSIDTIAPRRRNRWRRGRVSSSHTSRGESRRPAPSSRLPAWAPELLGAALRWNSGIAVHSTSPGANSQADATVAATENR